MKQTWEIQHWLILKIISFWTRLTNNCLTNCKNCWKEFISVTLWRGYEWIVSIEWIQWGATGTVFDSFLTDNTWSCSALHWLCSCSRRRRSCLRLQSVHVGHRRLIVEQVHFRVTQNTPSSFCTKVQHQSMTLHLRKYSNVHCPFVDTEAKLCSATLPPTKYEWTNPLNITDLWRGPRYYEYYWSPAFRNWVNSFTFICK